MQSSLWMPRSALVSTFLLLVGLPAVAQVERFFVGASTYVPHSREPLWESTTAVFDRQTSSVRICLAAVHYHEVKNALCEKAATVTPPYAVANAGPTSMVARLVQGGEKLTLPVQSWWAVNQTTGGVVFCVYTQEKGNCKEATMK